MKQCCAAVYESDAAKLLLGEFVPSGRYQADRASWADLNLTPQTRVLDVAAGKGTSATFLASRFGCEVVGHRLRPQECGRGRSERGGQGLRDRVSFQWADAERIPFADASFDAVICECAFCTFPDKTAAAGEFARVLRAGGQVGLSDLTRNGALAPELDGLLSWIACIADAQPLAAYVSLLSAAGLNVRVTEEHNAALVELVNQVRTRILAAEVLVGLKKLALPGFDFEEARKIAKHALQAVAQGELGYALVTASRVV